MFWFSCTSVTGLAYHRPVPPGHSVRAGAFLLGSWDIILILGFQVTEVTGVLETKLVISGPLHRRAGLFVLKG